MTINLVSIRYVLTPLFRSVQDMAQGQFLSGLQLLWIQIVPSSTPIFHFTLLLAVGEEMNSARGKTQTTIWSRVIEFISYNENWEGIDKP